MQPGAAQPHQASPLSGAAALLVPSNAGQERPRLEIQSGFPRQEAEHFIQHCFAQMHGARVSEFMPTLLGLRNDSGDLYCACGLRSAGQAPLFIETYLAAPVESCLQDALGSTEPLPRGSIVEVGNLAIAAPGTARELIAALTEYLTHTHFQWVICAALTSLRNAFLRLEIPLIHLAPAPITALPEAQRAAWGSYYQHNPQVIAINVQAAAQALASAHAAPGRRQRP